MDRLLLVVRIGSREHCWQFLAMVVGYLVDSLRADYDLHHISLSVIRTRMYGVYKGPLLRNIRSVKHLSICLRVRSTPYSVLLYEKRKEKKAAW